MLICVPRRCSLATAVRVDVALPTLREEPGLPGQAAGELPEWLLGDDLAGTVNKSRKAGKAGKGASDVVRVALTCTSIHCPLLPSPK